MRFEMIKIPAVILVPLLFTGIFASPAVCQLLSSEERMYLQKKGTVVFVSQTVYPPFEFVGEDGDHTGMCIELARWMSTQMGFKAKFTDMPFQQAQEAVLNGRADVITSLFYSEKRDTLFDFTRPLFQVPANIFVSADRPDIKELSDLNGKVIAVQKGDYAIEYLHANNIVYTPEYTSNFSEAANRVIAGRADAVIGDEQIVLYHLYSGGLISSMKKVGMALFAGQNCMAVKEGGGPLIQILDKGASLALELGVLDSINRKWLGIQYAYKESFFSRNVSYFLGMAAALICSVVLIWLWNIRLRKEVTRRTDELSQSENTLRTILTDSPIGIGVIRDQRMDWHNQAMTGISGYEPDELRGLSPIILYADAQEADRVGRIITSAFDEGKKVLCDTRWRRKNGTVFDCRLRYTALDSRGRKNMALALAEDITEQKQAENRLRERERFFNSIFNSIQDGICVLNPDLKIISTNRTFQKWFPDHFPQEGKACYRVYRDRERPCDGCPILHALDRPHPGKQVIPSIRHKYGSRILEVYCSPLLNDVQEAVGVVEYVRDITPNIQAEKALQESESRYRSLFENANDAIFIHEPDGIFLEVNPQACQRLGYSRQELLKLSPGDIDALEFKEKIPEHIHRLHARGRAVFETVHVRRNGKTIPTEINAQMINFQGRTAVLSLARDITSRKRMEDLMRIQRDLGISLGFTENLQDALRLCLEAALKVQDIDCGGIYVRDPKTEGFRLMVHEGLNENFINRTSYFSEDTPQAAIICKGKPVFHSYKKVVRNLGLDSEDIAVRKDAGLKAVAVVPILHEGRAIAALNVASCTRPEIPDFARYSLEAIASQFAGGLSRIRSDQALKASQRNFQALFETLDDFLFVLDDSGRIVGHNPVVEKRLGYTSEELKELSVLDMHPPEQREEAADLVQKMLDGKSVYCPIPLLTGTGRQIPVETKIAQGIWNDRKAIFGISRDITDRLKAEEAKRISEERLLAAIDAIDEGFAIFDPEDRLSMCNARFRHLYAPFAHVIQTGVPYEEIIRTGIQQGYFPEAAGREEAWLADRMAAHLSGCSRLEQKNRDGRWLRISERRTRDGSIVGFRVDITDIKRSEELTQAALKEKETLLREIHHRVKNNMQVVNSLLSLQAGQSENRRIINAFAEARTRVQSMSLAHEILYQSENLTRIDLQPYLETLSEHILQIFAPKSGDVRIRIRSEGVTLGIDQAVPCGLVVSELLTNALKYAFPGPNPPEISIEAAPEEENRMHLKIKDNGKGFEQPFNPLEIPTLGLQLVTELVEDQLEGAWRVSGTNGVCWTINWPIKQELLK